MANALYTNYAHLMLGYGSAAHTLPDWDTDNIKCVAVDHTDHTPAPDTDQDLTDIDAGGRVATSGNMGTIAIAGGAVDMADFAFTSVTGDGIDSLNWYKDTADPSTSPLAIYIDTATGLPCTPNGANINVVLAAGGLLDLVA
jgi:hypothetical protein